MRKITTLFIISCLFGAFLTPNTACAQYNGGIIPIFLIKKATGYWDNDDADGDGVVDSEDLCPNVYGTMNGCPDKDTDGDGVPDSKDECPNVKGKKEHNGCVLSKAEKEIIRKASANIYFESGSAKIKEESFESLQTLAGLLNKHPEIKTTVEGHTDSSGDSAFNLQLSKDRAAAVRDYLVKHGESLDNIASEGYGSSKPVASNDTKEGRAKNRRVEIVVTLLEQE